LIKIPEEKSFTDKITRRKKLKMLRVFKNVEWELPLGKIY
jgi:hypothetical protein